MKPDARNLSVNMRGEDVKILQERLNKLGFSIEDKDGFFGKTTRRAVLEIQKKHGMKATGIVDEATDEVIMNNARVDEKIDLNVPVKKEPVRPGFIVHGNVHNNDGTPRPGLTVNAFDQNIRMEDTFLGQNVTDEKGNYSISYTLDQLNGKDSADLVVGVYQNEKLLQDPVVIVNADPVKEIDFIFTVEGVPEFQQTTTKILPLLRNRIKLAGLEKKDIDYLNKRTGINTPKIERLAQSHKLSGGNETLSAFYYGLLSQDLPTDPAALLSRDRASINRALSRAESMRLIPALNPQDVERIMKEELPRLRAENLLRPAEAEQLASLGDLLRAIPESLRQTIPELLSDDHQRKVADLIAQDGIDYTQLQEQLTKTMGFSQDHAIVIERTLRLGDLTLRNPPLMKHLHEITLEDQDSSLKSLAAFGRDRWIDKAYAYGVPAGSDLKKEAYAKQLENATEKLHPTAVLSARLNAGDLVIARPGFEKVGTFLSNNPDFDILHTNIPGFTEKANLDGVENKDELVKSMLKIQRVKKLSATWEETGALLNSGMDSALHIVNSGQERLQRSLGDQVEPERAALIYQYAKKTHDMGLALMTSIMPRFSPTPVAAMGNAIRLDKKIIENDSMALRSLDGGGGGSGGSSENEYATIQQLFGALDYCECKHDQSVLSPAAYFVDLLQFLDRNSETAHTTQLFVWLNPSGIPGKGEFSVTATFSEKVTGLSEVDIKIINGTVSPPQTMDGKTYTFTVFPAMNKTLTLYIPADSTKDYAGNSNKDSNTLEVSNDTIRPNVWLSTASTNVNGEFSVIAIFSEEVKGLSAAKISVINGTASNLKTTIDPKTYTFNVDPKADDVEVSIPDNSAMDAAGNPNKESNKLKITKDTSRPAVELSTASPPVNGEFTLTATFYEAVIYLQNANISITNGIMTSPPEPTNSGKTYTFKVKFDPEDAETVTVCVEADSFKDAAGNPNTASNKLEVTKDNDNPFVTLSIATPPVNGVFSVIATFSEKVTGLSAGNISITNGRVSDLQPTDGAITYTFNVKFDLNAETVTLIIPADSTKDYAGNSNYQSNTLEVANDIPAPSRPTVTVRLTDPFATTISSPFNVTAEFGEKVTDLTINRIKVTGILGIVTQSNLQHKNDGKTWTFDVYSQLQGTQQITVQILENAARDAEGHFNKASNSLTVYVQGSMPTIIASAPKPPVGSKSNFTTFSGLVIQSPLAALLARRPDLVDMELSSDNTKIELPYIDLVLEILENTVAFSPPYPIYLRRPYTDAEDALNEVPLPNVITNVLQKTTLEMIGSDLKATKEKRKLPCDDVDAWTVIDGQRRWTLHNQDAGITTKSYSSSYQNLHISNKETNIDPLINDLNNGILHMDLKTQIEKSLQQSASNRYFSISDYSISPVNEGKQWKVNCRLGAKIISDINGDEGTFTIQTSEGTNIFTRKYSSAAVQASLDGLQRGEIDGVLGALIPNSDDIYYENLHDSIVNGEATQIDLPGGDFRIDIEPDSLTIDSLTYQTSGDTENLKAMPANQNPLAYEKLRNENFPWSLPFNLPLEAVRAYLDRTGITRRQLIELSKPETYLDDPCSVNEVLGISSEETDMITNSAQGEELWKNWGLKPDGNGNVRIFDASAGENMPPDDQLPEGPLKVLSRVSILMQQARISYDDLMKILQTKFVSSNLSFNFQFNNPMECRPCKIEITNLNPDHLDRIHRFIRLWRKVGWEISELDLAINSFYSPTLKTYSSVIKSPVIEPPVKKPPHLIELPYDITQDTLIILSHIKRLKELLDLPVKVLITWWSHSSPLLYRPNTFPGQPTPKTLYEQLFLNPHIQGQQDPDFAINSEKSNLLNSGEKTLNEKASFIAAALGIHQEDFIQLLSQSKLTNSLTLHNLFELYRTAGLVRALRLSVTDFYRVQTLMNCNPFENTRAMIRFSETVKFIQNSGFTVEELAYLLQNETQAGLPLLLSEDQVDQMLKEIISAMQTKLNAIDQQVRDLIQKNPSGPTVLRWLTGNDAVEADAAAISIGYAPGDSASGVTRDLTLPGKGENNTTIDWKSLDESYVKVDSTNPDDIKGKIRARPLANEVDANVTLEGTISTNNTSPVTRKFDLTVLSQLPPDQVTKIDASSLTIESIGFAPGDSADGVNSDLTLPGKGANNTTIDWKSLDESYVKVDSTNPDDIKGKIVARPSIDETDKKVTLEATVKAINAPDITRSFVLTVLKQLAGEQAVKADAKALTIGYIPGDSPFGVTGNHLLLPDKGANGSTITWSSSNPVVIGNDGKVTRPSSTGENVSVLVTAIIASADNSIIETRYFYSPDLLNRTPLDKNRLTNILLHPDMRAQLSDVILGTAADLFGLEQPVVRQLLVNDKMQNALLKNPFDPNKGGIEVFFDSLFVSSDASTDLDSKTFSDAYTLVNRLHKSAIILSRLNVRSREIAWFDDSVFDIKSLNFNNLPPDTYLFCWDEIPESDSIRFMDFLKQKLGIDGIRKENIKRNDEKTINISNDISLTLDDQIPKANKANLKIKDIRTGASIDIAELTARMENGRLNLYMETINVNKLFQDWFQRIVTLFQIRDSSTKMGGLLANYAAQVGLSPADPLQVRKVLADGLSIEQGIIEEAAGTIGITDMAQYRDPFKLKELLDLLYAMKKLGTDANQVKALTADSKDLDAKAESLARSLLRSKYGADSWREIIKPVSNKLRIMKRDVLVDYLIYRDDLRDANELYEYYLIDPQMSPCMLTSRLVQATASVQLFIQRCLLNLEDVTLNKDDCNHWEWMKNYRVWEANRRVFLFPQNCLFPELRDDKTETFKALESGISQGEPNNQLAKDNLLNYLEELNEIAKITVYGMFESIREIGSRQVHMLDIVGRSPNQPYSYYWRQCTAFGDAMNMKWSGWELISDITDDHVMPFVMDNDLYIAWPTITKATKTSNETKTETESKTDAANKITTTTKTTDPNAIDYWEIKLNWIRRTNRGWTKKKVSKGVIPQPDLIEQKTECQGLDADKEITFRIKPNPDLPDNIDFCVYFNKLFSNQPEGSIAYVDFLNQKISSYDGIFGPTKVGYRVLNILANYPKLKEFLLKHRDIVTFIADNSKIIDFITDKSIRSYIELRNLAEDIADASKLPIKYDPVGGPAYWIAYNGAHFWAKDVERKEDSEADIIADDAGTVAAVLANPALIPIVANAKIAAEFFNVINNNETHIKVFFEYLDIINLIAEKPDLVNLIANNMTWWDTNFEAIFKVYPFTRLLGIDENNKEITWYKSNDDDLKIMFRFHYVYDISKNTWDNYNGKSYIETKLSEVKKKSDKDGTFYECIFYPKTFEKVDRTKFEDEFPTRFLRRVEVLYYESLQSINSEPTRLICYEPPFDNMGSSVIKSFSQNAIAGYGEVKTTLHLTPLGRFILNDFGDITVNEPAEGDVPPDIEADCSYANGYTSIGNGLQLKINETNAFTISDIKHLGFVIPSARLLEELNKENVWYFEYPPTMPVPKRTQPNLLSPQSSPYKLYIDGVIIEKNEMTVKSYLEIYDNIIYTAKLRETAYKNFDELYLPVNQKTLQKNNFWPSYSQINGVRSLDNDKWAGFERLDQTGFALQAPFSLYNWELLYHAPMLIAEFLTKQQRFVDAQKWLHYVFDPTKPDDDQGKDHISKTAQFWRFLPFRQKTIGAEPTPSNEDSLQELLNLLAKKAAGVPYDSPKEDELTYFTYLIEEWKDFPFLPFLISRVPLRWVAFEWRTIFAYLDNLIAWGDQMFRQNTRESINEAIQLYILAAKLLGPRPKSITPQHHRPDLSYRSYYGQWDEFSNAWSLFSDILQVKSDPQIATDELQTLALSSLGMLYFCIPSNDKLLGYWDTVEDRLLKVRNCMNIDGIIQELPLFAPPIDPELLVRATAAGLDIASILNDMYAPLLPYRFNVLLQKANEICGEVKSLGATLLATLEKKDAEELALLRSSQEIELQKLITYIKEQQVKEAYANIEVLDQNMAIAKERFSQYQKLLGKSVSLDQSGQPVLEASSSLQVAANAPGEVAGLGLIQYEVDQLNSLDLAHKHQEAAGIASTISGVMHAFPDNITGNSMVSQIKLGGSHLGNAASAVASFLNMLSSNASNEANRKSMFASYQRRQDEWVFQSKLALEEQKQIKKQIIAANIRKAIAERELNNHIKQIEEAQKIKDFLQDKYTNQELYSWMVGEISGVYFSSYQLAYDMAKRAERAFQHELGVENTSFVKFGYWDSLKKGLLSGESLSLDLKRMETAYMEKNIRELEITKHLSLQQLDPLALLQFKTTGSCQLTIPESFFDMDCPGHYMRRLKTVSLSIPCVTGPYTSVNCTLTLLKSTVRISPRLKNNKYERILEEDDRFKDYYGTIQSVVTSSGQNDSGLFETNLRDERYLPFELSGAVSQWRLELPADVRQFDYNTISDAILHLRYTARDGGGLLRKGASEKLKTMIDEAKAAGLVRLFSVRHEFPMEWAKFTSVKIEGTTTTAGLPLALLPQHYPFWAQTKLVKEPVEVKVIAVGLFAKMQMDEIKSVNLYDNADPAAPDIKIDTLNQNPSLGNLLTGNLINIKKPGVIADATHPPLTLYFDDNKIEELWIGISWGKD